MKKLLLLLTIALIPFLLSCKKDKSDPEPKGIPLFDLTVYDSDLWTPQNRFPVAADVEVEIFERNYIKEFGVWIEGDSVVSIFTGKTNSKGIVTVIKADTSNSARASYQAKLKKGARSNFSPEGFICGGVFESDEDIRSTPKHPKTPIVGDKKLIDFNGDGLVCCIYDKSPFGVKVWYSHYYEEPATCWLY